MTEKDNPYTEIDRPVQRIQFYNRVLYWLTQALVVFVMVAYGLTVVWIAFGMKQSHWSFYVMAGAHGIDTLLLIPALVIARQKNKISDGNCHKCGGVIQGSPPDDWVLECEDCGQEWVFAGKTRR